MADDNSARYQSDESSGRGQATPANDPLAELARLIGRGDPFSDYAQAPRSPAQPSPPDTSARYDNDPMPSFLGNPSPPYGSEPPSHYAPEPAPQQHYSPEPAPQHYAPEPAPQRYAPEPPQQHYAPEPPQQHYAPEPPQHHYSPEPAPQHFAPEPPRYAPEYPTNNGWPGSPPAPSYPASDPFVPPPQSYAPPPPARHYDSQGYAPPNFASQPFADPRGRPGMDNYSPDRAGFAPAGFPAPPERPGFAPPPRYPHEPEAGGMPPPHDDEFYDDEPRGGRRKGLLTVVAVLALAVVGTAGAFGYRSIFGGAGSSSSSVPVIRASGEPSKVAPPAATADPSAGKFSYDRFGDAGKDEQVVRREEKPVDLSKVTPPPRTVFPGAPIVNSTTAKQAAPATTSAANPPSAIGEPRRVRTVPIRPDQGGDVTAAPPAQRPATVAASAADDPPPATRPTPPPAAPRATPRVAARSAPPPAVAQAPAGNAPLSLAPEANNNSLPAPAQETFPPPPRAAAPPTRVATAPASGGGSYLVQVSSQKSEADAESAYRGIRSKYSSVLGNHPHTVRRADLGSKGIYYRAMVGPFASREEAVQMCSSLKQAGGDCVVQH